jgi:NAD dependent epimerase/dehydratase family enzyme
MKVLITGGTGLIGSALARSLVQDGHEVVVLTRNPNKDKQKVGLPSAVRLVALASSPPPLQEAGYQFKFTHINNALNDLL